MINVHVKDNCTFTINHWVDRHLSNDYILLSTRSYRNYTMASQRVLQYTRIKAVTEKGSSLKVSIVTM